MLHTVFYSVTDPAFWNLKTVGMCLTLFVTPLSDDFFVAREYSVSISVCVQRKARGSNIKRIQQEQSSVFYININAANLVTHSQTTFLAFEFAELGLTTDREIRLWGLENPVRVTVRY